MKLVSIASEVTKIKNFETCLHCYRSYKIVNIETELDYIATEVTKIVNIETGLLCYRSNKNSKY